MKGVEIKTELDGMGDYTEWIKKEDFDMIMDKRITKCFKLGQSGWNSSEDKKEYKKMAYKKLNKLIYGG